MTDWIDRIFATPVMSNVLTRTLVSYVAALRYWDSWHQLRYGVPLSLSEQMPRSVTTETVSHFVEDHLPIARDGRLHMRMRPSVECGLREAGFNARINCCAPATTHFRLQVLERAHRLLGLWLDHAFIRAKKAELYAAWEAERAALGAPAALPMSAANIQKSLLRVCGNDREGIMDAALVVLLCRLTPLQATRLRMSDLLPGTLIREGEEVDVVELTIRKPVGRLQRFQPKVRFVENEAISIKSWGAIRDIEIQLDGLFFVRQPWGTSSRSLNYLWIRRRLHRLAQRAGLADSRGRSLCSPRWLRNAFERGILEQTMLVKVARAARVGTSSVINIMRARDNG